MRIHAKYYVFCMQMDLGLREEKSTKKTELYRLGFFLYIKEKTRF